jgi:hypothetical protein
MKIAPSKVYNSQLHTLELTIFLGQAEAIFTPCLDYIFGIIIGQLNRDLFFWSS